VSSSTIGIKIADGSFYPIVERDSGRWKRVILTTVKDEQTNVQIDLYEGEGADIESAKYVGSLLIEEIVPSSAGESEIELRVGVEEDGKLSARAEDLGSGESQSLNVSLESLTEDNIYDIPEFELGNEFDAWSDSDDSTGGEVEDEYEAETTDTFDSNMSFTEEDQYTDSGLAYVAPPKRKPLLLALFIIFGIAAVAALTIFLYKIFEGPSVPPLEARQQTPTEIAADSQSEAESPADTIEANPPAVVEADTTVEPVVEESVRDGPLRPEATGVTPSASDTFIGGVWYWIRWGDTLWDISSSFYRTPWHYGRIANENSIRNPDLIFAGAKIFIPKEN
jgi:hypothetical protein